MICYGYELWGTQIGKTISKSAIFPWTHNWPQSFDGYNYLGLVQATPFNPESSAGCLSTAYAAENGAQIIAYIKNTTSSTKTIRRISFVGIGHYV